MIRDTGGLSGRPDSRLSALRPESVTREFRPSFPCPGRTYGKQKQVQGLFRQAGWVIRHGTVVTPAGWHRTTRAVRYIQRRSRTSCIVKFRQGLGRFLAGRPARSFPRCWCEAVGWLRGRRWPATPTQPFDSVTRLVEPSVGGQGCPVGSTRKRALCRHDARRAPGGVVVAVRCSALESFAGGRAALPVYQHKGRMFRGARGRMS